MINVLVSVLVFQSLRDYPSQHEFLGYDQTTPYTSISIAKYQGRKGLEPRLVTTIRPDEGRAKTVFSIDLFEVIDSTDRPEGSPLVVLLNDHSRSVSDEYKKLTPGAIYLVFAGGQQNGQIVWRSSMDGVGLRMESLVEAKSTDEVIGFCALETRALVLPSEKEPISFMSHCLAPCLNAGGFDQAQNISDNFLRRLGGMLPVQPQFRPEDDMSRTWRKAASESQPYERALVLYQLNAMHYLGTGDEFYRAIAACATDQRAFPTGVPLPQYWEDTTGYRFDFPKDFKHDDQDPIAYSNLLISATNDQVQEFLMFNIGFNPGPELDDVFVKQLSRMSEPKQRELIGRLAEWKNEPTQVAAEPEYVMEKGARVPKYRDLADKVKYWKKKLLKGKPEPHA